MSEYDFQRFKRKIYIKAPLAEVFNAWVRADKLETWFIKDALYKDSQGRERKKDEIPQKGDSYFWEWHQDLKTSGTVLEVIRNDIFKFTFGKKSRDSEEDVVVTIKFGFKNDETWYTLTQENMGDELSVQATYHLSCNLGWSFFMTNMKALLEHGVDLREYDAERAYETRAVSL